MIEVWNKLDLVEGAAREALMVQAAQRSDVLAVSALTGDGLPRLLDAVSHAFEEEKTERELRLPFDQGRKRAWLHEAGVVTAERQTKTGHVVTVRWTAKAAPAVRSAGCRTPRGPHRPGTARWAPGPTRATSRPPSCRW
jgi:GTPase